MMSRRARAVLLAILATFALDFVDADCVGWSWASDVECPAPGEDCACCVASEEPALLAAVPLAPLPARAPAAAHDPRRAGFRRVPYRPPLHHS